MSSSLPNLRSEQWELFDAMVEAERRRAMRGDPRDTFAVIYADQATVIQHPDLELPGGPTNVSEGDILALLNAGLLETSGSDTLLQVSGYGETTYERRHGGMDPQVQARDAQWQSSIDRFASRLGNAAGSLVALTLIAIFALATVRAFQEGSSAGAGVSLVVLVVSIFSFANTAFGIGPMNLGRKLGRWLEPRIAGWLHRRLDPPS